MGHLGQPHLQLKQWKDGPIEATEWGHIPLGQPSPKTVVQENGFLYGESRLQQNRTISDHCVFVTKVSADDFIILLLYVDDILIVGHGASKIEKLKRELRSLKPLVTIVT